MDTKSIAWYGYEKHTFTDCRNLIDQMNRRHMEVLNIWFILVTMIYLILSSQNSLGFSHTDTPYFFGFIVATLAFEVVILRFKTQNNTVNMILVIINMISLLVFGIICSLSQPYMAATIFPVMLVIVSLSHVGNMYAMVGILLAGSGVFFLVSYLVKPGSIFNQDVFNVAVVQLISIVLHYTFQRARIRQFITYRQSTKMQHELEIKSSFDALTSLLNRGRFFSMAQAVLNMDNEEDLRLILMDLDKFKEVNDTLGHQMGDKVIQTAGNTILKTLKIEYGEKWSFPERAVRDQLPFAGRLGGDEFVFLLRKAGSEEETKQLLQTLLTELNAVRLEGLDGIHASVGVTSIQKNDRDIDAAYNRADEALYRSKEAGRNRITFHEE